MKYLDEQIVEQKVGTIAGTSTGIYEYRVLRKNDSDNSYTTIFIGSMFHQYGTAFRVDITDIVRNDCWTPDESGLYSSSDIAAQTIKLVNTYKVDFIVGGTSYRTDGVQVAKVYRYPHKLQQMINSVFFDYVQYNQSVSFPLQGRYNLGGYGYYHLTPRYPYISTDNYKMILASEDGLNYTSGTMNIKGKYMGSQSVSFTPPATLSTYKLSSLYNIIAPNELVGSFGTAHTGQDVDFTFSDSTDGKYITATNQSYCYCKFVSIDNSRYIDKEFSEWCGWDDFVEGQITIDSDFISANNNKLVIMFSATADDDIYNVDNSGGWIEYSFNLPSDTTKILNKTYNFDFYLYEVSWMYKWKLPTFNLTLTNPSASSDKTLVEVAGDYVAEIDECYSRYYLQWQDRMGAFQSQPFNEHYTYSENVERETITDYRGVKRVSGVNVTPKFKINTDWIKEDLYPYYESIFTSPVLFLYDTKEDKRYSVLVTDSEYTEKTYDNQKKLFNLSLNLELNQHQNIIY